MAHMPCYSGSENHQAAEVGVLADAKSTQSTDEGAERLYGRDRFARLHLVTTMGEESSTGWAWSAPLVKLSNKIRGKGVGIQSYVVGMENRERVEQPTRVVGGQL